MDRKSIIIVLFCLVALVGWNILINKLYPPKPLTAGSTNTVATVESALSTNAIAQGDTTTNLIQPAITNVPTRTTLIVDTNVPEQIVVITNENARYTFTSHGGGLKQVELIGAATKRELESGRIPALNLNAPTPAFAIVGGDIIEGNGVFQLTRTATGVRAEKQLDNGLLVVKEFVPGSNYLLHASVRLENQSTQALSLPQQKWIVGTATPLNADDNGKVLGFMWHDGKKSRDTIGSSYFSRTSFCMPRTPPEQFTSEGQSNVVWFAVHNQFFAMASIPSQPALQAVAREVPLPPPDLETLAESPRAVRAPVGYEAALIFPAVTLAPQQAVAREVQVYAGPKEYRILARLGNNLDAIMAFGRFFGFFSKALLLGMNWLHHALSIPYGWAIIVITIIIKMLFWPLTQASTRSMKRMQALQPQMKALQEKYKDDPLKAQRKLMEFMKENKVNPMGGCLPMLLQMPVFIGFFYMIRSAIELRGASFLWVGDLSRPDTLFYVAGFPFNLLPLLMGATMLWQAHLTPPSPGMDPVQQKMMRYMPLMFMVFLYNFSAGLTLYWTVQNLLTIAQTKLTKTKNEPPAQPVPPAKAPALTRPQKKKK